MGREAEAKAAGVHQHNGTVEVNMEEHDSSTTSSSSKTQEKLEKHCLEQELEGKRATGIPLKFQQFKAMLVKKCIYAVRNRVLLLVQVSETSRPLLHFLELELQIWNFVNQ